jgi:hypothetical protein
MPFEEKFSFVYELGIKPVVSELAKELEENKGISLHVTRADELASTVNKVEDIIKSINNNDLILADITENRPSVLWELGLCHAFEKDVFILRNPERRFRFI